MSARNAGRDESLPPPGRSCGGVIILAFAFVAGLALLTLMGRGLLVETGLVPDSAIVPGERLPGRVVQKLRDEQLLEADEAIEYFYSPGLISFLHSGSFFTNQRVVLYDIEEGESTYWAATYVEITSIMPRFSDDSSSEDTTVQIHADGQEPFTLVLSDEDDLDHEFVDVLFDRWHAAR